MDTHYYDVNLGWQYDRLGQLSAPGINDLIEVATPVQFAKGMPGIWSPEHLLVGAVVSCFMTTFLAIAENSRLDFEDFDCQARGKLEETQVGPIISEIVLRPLLLISHESDSNKAQNVLTKSERHCLITNSVQAKVTMIPTIKVVAKEFD